MKNLLFTFFFFIAVIIVFIFINKSNKKRYIEKLRSKQFCGQVDSVFIDKDSKMQPRAILSDGSQPILVNENIITGDTYCKKEGDLFFIIVRNGDTTRYFDNYLGESIK